MLATHKKRFTTSAVHGVHGFNSPTPVQKAIGGTSPLLLRLGGLAAGGMLGLTYAKKARLSKNLRLAAILTGAALGGVAPVPTGVGYLLYTR